MKKFFKILAMVALLILVVFSLLADLPFMRQVEKGLSLAVYIRLASVLGLVALVFFAWGHKRQIESSQKFRRADEVLAQAESTAVRRHAELERLKGRLESDFAEKEAQLDQQIGQSVVAYQARLNRLQEQNVELKETVNKLMKALKAERARK
jgi:nitrogen fixation-related uncharacterized protein